jgi:hypothetical protein
MYGRTRPTGRLKRFFLALSFLLGSSCSDPSPGWLLWRQTYETLNGEPFKDTWSSYESFFKRAECKSQIPTEVAREVKEWKDAEQSVKDAKYTIQPEKESVRAKVVRVSGADKKTYETTTIMRFFCMPLGVDPRPKDVSIWTLWQSVAVGDAITWKPFETYLTRANCEQGREFQDKVAASNAAPFFFRCLPSGVNP